MPLRTSELTRGSPLADELQSLGYPLDGEQRLRPDDSGALEKRFRQEPLSYHQERLSFIDAFEKCRIYPDAPTYHNIPILLHIRGKVDPAVAEFCLNKLILRHEALRTRISQGMQSIACWDLMRLEVVEALPGATLAGTISRALERNLRPFSLSEDLLIRGTLFKIAPAEALLLVTVHHIIADLQSARILSDEFARFYAASTSGSSADLGPLPLTYAKFSKWQRQLPESVINALFCYWAGQLRSPPAPLELPCRRVRDRVHVYHPKTLHFEVAGEGSERLQGLAEELGSSVSTLLLAQFLIALYSCARQEEIVVGTSAASRTHPEPDSVVGPFSNLLVLRNFVRPSQNFEEVVQATERVVRQAMLNSQMPFDLLVQRLKPARDMSRTALFDVFYRFVEDAPSSWAIESGEIVSIPIYSGFGKYDLNLTFSRVQDKYRGILHYNARLFDPSFIDQLAELFLAGLDRASTDPGLRITDLIRLPTSVLEKQDAMLAPAPGAFPKDQTLDGAFSEIAAIYPDRVAVAWAHGQLTYACIEDRAGRLARELAEKGIGNGDLVAVLLQRTPDILVAVFAVLKCGAVYVPIDPAYPRARVELILEDSQAATVVTDRAAWDVFHPTVKKIDPVFVDAGAASGVRSPAFGSRSLSRGVAYCIYTSGSTGRPKGCLVSHRNAIQLILTEVSPFPLSGADVWTWFHSFCFDFSVWEIFGALLHGGRLAIVSPEEARDPAELADLMVREGVTVFNQTPASAYAFFEATLARDLRFPALKTVIFGGDALSPSRLRPWASRHPHVRLVNMYGITETTVHVTHKRLSDSDLEDDTNSVGKALPNLRLRLLSDDLEQLPIGVLGEIAVSGEGLSLGYWNRPAVTADRFVPDPFGEEGARLYLSGDFARLTFEGEVVFSGRRDHQVKIRGHRIELGEVEKTIESLPEVSEAAVVLVDQGDQNRSLAAFVVPAQGSALPIQDLRNRLEERLIDHMVPAFLETLESMPRNPSGKIDRNALRALPFGKRPEESRYVPPETEREHVLVDIWEEVLKQGPVGIHDDFFELGGDSVLSIQIIARATRAGISLSPKQFFEHPTVHALAALDAGRPEAEVGTFVRFAPLAPVQNWFFTGQHKDPHYFNQSLALELNPEVRPPHVEASLRFLMKRHDVLQTVFEKSGDGWRQRLTGLSGGSSFTVHQIEASTPEERRSAMETAAREAHRSFDLIRGPLFRVLYFDFGRQNRPHLLSIFHHLIIDAVSCRIFTDELKQLLAQSRESQPLDLGRPPEPYFRFAREMDGIQKSALLDDEAKSYLGGLPRQAPKIPRDLDADEAVNTYGNVEECLEVLDFETTQALLKRVHRVAKGGLEDALLSGIVSAVQDWTGCDSVLLDVESHGRQGSVGALDVSRTLGWFTTFCSLSLQTEGSCGAEAFESLRRQIEENKEKASRSFLWRHGSKTDRKPLKSEICVNYLGQYGPDARSSDEARLETGLDVAPISPRNRRRYLIDVSALTLEGRLHLRWEFCRRLHERDTIEALAANTLENLKRLASALDSKGPSDPGRLLEEAERPYPLAPAQVGMLYHSLVREEKPPAYVIQTVWTVEGALDTTAFRKAWQHLLERHEALRASFQWETPDAAYQTFAPEVDLPWVQEDWRGLAEAERSSRLESILEKDRFDGFDLRKGPLFSLRLIQIGADKAYFVWNIHHIIVDGWSIALLRAEFLELYDSYRKGKAWSETPAGSFRRYISYLAQMDERQSDRFWRKRLGAVKPFLLFSMDDPKQAGQSGRGRYEVQRLDLGLKSTQRIVEICRRKRLTVNTLVQGAWAVALSLLSGRKDVTYGVVVSGRPPSVSRIESTVGSFINTIPLPILTDFDGTTALWLEDIQAQFNESREHEHTPLSRISQWAPTDRTEPPFDTILVCENYPQGDRNGGEDVRFVEHNYHMRESFPLVLEFVTGRRLSLRLKYETDIVDAGFATRAQWLLDRCLKGIEAGLDRPLKDCVRSLKKVADVKYKQMTNEFLENKRKLLGKISQVKRKTVR